MTDPALVVAACGATVGMLISLYHVARHVANYNKPRLQRYIVRILFIVPVYAIATLLSIFSPTKALYFDTVRDCYEAFVIYCFLTLMLEYAGGDATCVAEMAINPAFIRHPVPFCCLPIIPLGGRFLRWCKQGTLQFVVVKPVMAFISLIMLGLDRYNDERYRICLLVVYNISYTLALYMLLLFYMATKHIIRQHHPVTKFFALKLVIFMPYWQALIIGVLPGVTPQKSQRLNDLILCIETTVFAAVQMVAFSYHEFKATTVTTDHLHNLGQVFSVRDVVQDTYHNFMPSYQDYVLSGSAEPTSDKEDDDGGSAPQDSTSQPQSSSKPKVFRATTYLYDIEALEAKPPKLEEPTNSISPVGKGLEKVKAAFSRKKESPRPSIKDAHETNTLLEMGRRRGSSPGREQELEREDTQRGIDREQEREQEKWTTDSGMDPELYSPRQTKNDE